MIIDDNTDLFHFGVKGMKWGVRKERRQERRDIKGERKQRLKEELNKELEIRQPKIAALTAQANRLAYTHNFDYDDGGGGVTSKDRAAGTRYMKLHEKIFDEESAAEVAAYETVAKELLDKYGATKLKELRIKP